MSFWMEDHVWRDAQSVLLYLSKTQMMMKFMRVLVLFGNLELQLTLRKSHVVLHAVCKLKKNSLREAMTR